MTPAHSVAIALRTVPLVAWLCTQSPPAHAADALGRLFFTPEIRQNLDRQRHEGAQAAHGDTARETLRIDGIVIGKNLRTTLWINGRPLTADPQTRAPLIRAESADPGRIVLQFPTFPPIRTRVGTEIDTATIQAFPPLAAWVKGAQPSGPAQ